MNTQSMVGLVVLVGLCADLMAQQPSFSVDVDVVHILATVQDKNGDLVKDLSREDFVLEVEGEVREITHFSQQSELPLVLGLMVDTSMSQRRILEEERRASYKFFEQVLRPESDRAFVIGFDVDVELLEDLTSSRDLLLVALESLEVPAEEGRDGVGTVLFDAIFLGADEVLGVEPGRKAIIVLSDGVDFGSMLSIETAIESAHRADAMVYSIRYFDSEMKYGGGGGRRPPMGGGRTPGGRPGGGPGGGRNAPNLDGKVILKRLSDETGGGLFEVTKKMPLEDIFARIEEELRHQYSIGFVPKSEGSQQGFQRINLKARQDGLTVRTRQGFFAQ